MRLLGHIPERELLWAVYDATDDEGWATASEIAEVLRRRGWHAEGSTVAWVLGPYVPGVVERTERQHVTPPGYPVCLYSLCEETVTWLTESGLAATP